MNVLTPEKFLKIKRQETTVNVSEFCEKWIPKIYGVQPGERGYRTACVSELAQIVGTLASFQSIYTNWNIKDDENGYPKYVKQMLDFADKEHTIAETLGLLPRKQIPE
ncbi:hypothetical protein NIES4101_53930 [Calothrix sp. NIES-4101]|nr:hypothetical protein NIES4101_53930 [Calothrix sp. NIES-4101]